MVKSPRLAAVAQNGIARPRRGTWLNYRRKTERPLGKCFCKLARDISLARPLLSSAQLSIHLRTFG